MGLLPSFYVSLHEYTVYTVFLYSLVPICFDYSFVFIFLSIRFVRQVTVGVVVVGFMFVNISL